MTSLTLALLLAGAPVRLDAQHEPLRARFDAEVGRPRLLMILSPT
jgi:hypothetical protein